MQTALLGLGGLLLAGAAVTVTVIAFAPGGGTGKVWPLTLLTLVSLALPVLLARRGLTATGETVASVALLLVLLDGYVAWRVGLFGAGVLPTSVYFGLVCLVTAGIAIAYSNTSHLVAPRYATLLVLQPVLPLLAYTSIHSAAGWALVLSGVAVMDLAFGFALTTRAPITVNLSAAPAPPAGPATAAEPATVAAPGAPEPTPTTGVAEPDGSDPPAVVVDPLVTDPLADDVLDTGPADRPDSGQLSRGVLRDAAWALFAIAYGAALVYATTALATADGAPPTVRAALVLILAAAVGVAGGLIWRRRPVPDVTEGIATIAFILSAARVSSVELPQYALVLTAVAVAIAAVAVRFLPTREDTARPDTVRPHPVRLDTVRPDTVRPDTVRPDAVRPGPRLADMIAAVFTGLAVLSTALPVIAAPVRAVTPVWRANLDRYSTTVDAATGPHGWQLFLAALLLTFAVSLVAPDEWRIDAVVIGLAVSGLIGPGALGLGWLLTPAVAVLAAVAFGVVALIVPIARTAWICLGAAATLGTYATAASLASPAATAVTLTAITIAGAVIGTAPRPARSDPHAEMVAQRVTDAAAGGALFALPGAAASGAAVAVLGVAGGAAYVLVAGFLALAVALGLAALTQVARQRQSAPLLIGATLGAAIVVVAALRAPERTLWDLAIALLMVVSVALLWLAPSIDERQTYGSELTGADTAAAAVTVAGIAAVARALTLVAPGSQLITVATLVLIVAVATRALPRAWRPGPVTGAAVVGAAAAVWAGVLALGGAAGVLHAARPLWHAVLGDDWQGNADRYAHYGWQVPVALLLLALAGAIALPEPRRDGAAATTLGLAAIGAPVALGLGWTSPMLIGWAVATGLGVAAALAGSARAAYTRLTVGVIVGAFAAGASLVRATTTAGTLLGLALSSVLVAGLAALVIALRTAGAPRQPDRAAATIQSPTESPTGSPTESPTGDPGLEADDTLSPDEETQDTDQEREPHLVRVGGVATTGALLAFTGACATTAGSIGYAQEIVVSAALAACSLGLAVAGLLCRDMRGYLPYVTAGVAAGAIIAALATVPTSLPAAVYAANAALIGVLAEVLRVDSRIPDPPWLVRARFIPDRTRPGERPARPVRLGRPADPSGSFAYGVTLAAGIPAAIALVSVAPAVVAALIGPYRWLTMPWTGTPGNASNLGVFQHWVGSGTGVLAAFILTLAAALAAVGLGGDSETVASRAVAVIVPGLAITVLMAPAALHMPWPAQPSAGLLVAAVAGLGLALTVPPPPNVSESGLRDARRLVFIIAILAAGAGGAGSLATRSQTISWLAGSVVVGLIAALRGRTGLARILGWQVAAGTALMLAVAIVLAAGRTLADAAFAVLFVVALLLALAASLPRLHRTDTTQREIMTIELMGYVGGLLAVATTFGAASRTAAALFAFGAVLGIAAARPGRAGKERTYLIVAASVTELVAVWVLLVTVRVAYVEAYTLPFALLALVTGYFELKFRPDLGSWLAYGPALAAGFAPTLVIVLITNASPERRVLLIAGAALTVAIGAVRRHQAPVAVGGIVLTIATLHELVLVGGFLPWPILLALFAGAGALLVALGATYERRRGDVRRLRGVYSQMR
jgi:hypothetical protein